MNELIWDPADQIDRTTPVAAYYSSGDITPIRIEFADEREDDAESGYLRSRTGHVGLGER